ncbi:unnamed protein product [Gadus morhua 'NCC']
MSDRPGRYTELSQRGIGENSFHGITLNGGKSSDKTLDPKQFFLTVAENLEDRMLSQGGRMPDKTGYNKFIEELKVLYAQYWPEDAGEVSVVKWQVAKVVFPVLPPATINAVDPHSPPGNHDRRRGIVRNLRCHGKKR